MGIDDLTDEAQDIVKAVDENPDAHIHYTKIYEWDMYPSKEVFDDVQKGFVDKSDVVIMSGCDFYSSYASPLVEALLFMQGGTVSSV